jgi:AcrR family transcriptional regulator
MGRHREFNPDEALDAVLAVFWRKGFEGTSFSDLTKATGVARPGLYAAFGNKEELFLKVLDRYTIKHLGFMSEALEEPTARAVVARILRGAADGLTTEPVSHGCLGVTGALAGSDEAEPIRQELVRRRSAGENALCCRLRRAEAAELPPGCSPETLARYVMTIAQGMAVQAKSGASRGQLYEVVDLTLGMWPQDEDLLRSTVAIGR